MTPLISNSSKPVNNRKEESPKTEPSTSTSNHQGSDAVEHSSTSGILLLKSSNGSSGKRSRLRTQLSRAKKSLSHNSFSFYPMHRKRKIRRSTTNDNPLFNGRHMDPAALLLRAALDQPAINRAILSPSSGDDDDRASNSSTSISGTSSLEIYNNSTLIDASKALDANMVREDGSAECVEMAKDVEILDESKKKVNIELKCDFGDGKAAQCRKSDRPTSGSLSSVSVCSNTTGGGGEELNVEVCLKELQTCQQVIASQGKRIIAALSRLDSSRTNNSSSLSQLSSRLTLFTMASSAMMDASGRFLEVATRRTAEHSKSYAMTDELNCCCCDEINDRRNTSRLQLLQRRQTTYSADDGEQFFDAFEQFSLEEPYADLSAGKTIMKGHPSSSSSSKTVMLDGGHVATSSVPPPATSDTHGRSSIAKHHTTSTLNNNPRRKRLPQRPSNSINYLSIMKNCIGKDLSRIAMPVDFNEPLSALQRTTEELEYAHMLLNRAAAEPDPRQRLALVAVFAISGYSTTGSRTTKPFNPLLGETYECDRRADRGWRSLAEQVSHHPPMCAMHAEADGWSLSQCYTITTKIKGRSLCVLPVGSTYLRISELGDLFVYNKVCTSTTMTNIVSGKLQTENHGDLQIVNVATGDRCTLKFHEQSGMFSRENTLKKVTGTVMSTSGRACYRIDAIWDRCATIMRLDPANDDEVLSDEVVWLANELPRNAAKMHNFTEFAIELNEPEPGVAPTDSRHRPDQRLMEQGDWTAANQLKQRLEEAQRKRARKAAAASANVEDEDVDDSAAKIRPLWFAEKSDREMLDKNDVYAFTGDYWRRKESQNWSMCPAIFKL